jgi:hypothetical protein
MKIRVNISKNNKKINLFLSIIMLLTTLFLYFTMNFAKNKIDSSTFDNLMIISGCIYFICIILAIVCALIHEKKK